MKRTSAMGTYFEPMMSMLLAGALGAIAATATVRYSIIDKSCAVVAVLLWLYLMKDFYDWPVDPSMGALAFFGPIGLIALAMDNAVYGAQLLLGVFVLALAFSRTRRFLTGQAGSGTL
ncbi:MAG: hypothetical protein J0I81_07385 [Hyphomicrobium sp.]|nr:hypothetical protein [Hyphomicrobium sp.]